MDNRKIDDIKEGLGDGLAMAREISMLNERDFVIRSAIMRLYKSIEQMVDYMAGIPLQVETKEAHFSGPYSKIDEIEAKIDRLAEAARNTDEHLAITIKEVADKQLGNSKTHLKNSLANSSRIGELESKLYNWDKLKGWNNQGPDSNQNKRLDELENRIVSTEKKLNASIERDITNFDVIRNCMEGIIEDLETERYA